MTIKRLSELIPQKAEFNYVLKKYLYTLQSPYEFFDAANALIDVYAKDNGWQYYSTLMRKWKKYEFHYVYIAFLYVPNPSGSEWKSFYNKRNHRFKDETLDKFFAQDRSYYLRTADNDTLIEEIRKEEENEKTIEEVKQRLSMPWF